MLVWEAGGEFFAVRTRECREVHLDVTVLPVPETPAHVPGVTTLRGEVVTVSRLPALRARCGIAGQLRGDWCCVKWSRSAGSWPWWWPRRWACGDFRPIPCPEPTHSWS